MHEHGRRFECLFCGGEYESMPWYGCCGFCYSGSAEVRAVVDAAHPQTWPSAVFDIVGARVPQDEIDAALDDELTLEVA